MATVRYFTSTAQDNTISASMDAVQTTFTATSTLTGWPTQYPFTAVLDSGTASEELIQVTAAPTGLVYPCSRGVDGTTAHTHAPAATVKHRASARDFSDANTHILATTGVHGLTAGDAVAGVTALGLKANDNAVPHLTGNETIAGVKTFSSSPAVPDNSFAQAKVAGLVTKLAALDATDAAATSAISAKADDSAVVKLTGNQTVAGTKTFSSAPVVPSNSFAESAVTNLTTDLGTHTTGIARALRVYGVGNTETGSPPSASTGGFLVQFDDSSGTCNASGNVAITFPVAFPNGCAVVIPQFGDATFLGGQMIVVNGTVSASGFTLRCYDQSGAVVNGGTVRWNYIAIGW